MSDKKDSVREFEEAVEKLIDGVKESYLERYSTNSNHYSLFETALSETFPNIWQNITDKPLRTLTGIHYLKKEVTSLEKRWLPIIFVAPETVEKYKTILGANPNLLQNHLCFCAHELGQDEDYVISIPKEVIVSSQFAESINLLLQTNGKNPAEPKDKSSSSTSPLGECTNFNTRCEEKLKKEVIGHLNKKSHEKGIASFLLGALLGFYDNQDQSDIHACFYNHPVLGGVAFISTGTTPDGEKLEYYRLLFRKLMCLIGSLDGFLDHWVSQESNARYRRYEINNDTSSLKFIQCLKSAIETYFNNLQLPKANNQQRQISLALEKDKHVPLYITERLGNREYNKFGRTVVMRLKVGDAAAFNFLHLEHALILNKLEEFLNGWIKGFLASGQTIQIKKNAGLESLNEDIRVRLDLYISPTVKDIDARNSNPYEIREFQYDELGIKRGSNFDCWAKRVLEISSEKMPAVVYRHSELVGPSIFLGEIASVILKHFSSCNTVCKTETLKVLDLFSGTCSAEATILSNCRNNIKIHFLAIDLEPNLLSDAYLDDVGQWSRELRNCLHIVPGDIFEISSYGSSGRLSLSTDIYSRGYDLILSDPPHFLALDFLYQKIGKENTLIGHLAKNTKVKCFILYFGHKEKEWLSFFIHMLALKEGWTDVWSVVVGDERFIICFNRYKGYPGVSKDCKQAIVEGLVKIGKEYKFCSKELEIKVYDTYYRKLHTVIG